MSIDLDKVSGLIEADTIDDNFDKLEEFLKENVKREDFNEKFTRYKIRRYTSGKIASFNTGVNPYSPPRPSSVTGTFENNWTEGQTEPTLRSTPTDWTMDGAKFFGDYGSALPVGVNYGDSSAYGTLTDAPDGGIYSLHGRPVELLGYPGGDLNYDFQEQGIPNLSEVHGEDISNFPPSGGPLQSDPKNECWSMWLTVPDAAGSVYVDEPCVALITATVRGNYFFSPALRSANQDLTWALTELEEVETPSSPGGSFDDEEDETFRFVGFHDHSGLYAIKEGQDQSAFLRLGLFVDTNPVVYDDEFHNGDDYGRPTGYGHGYNPWIGDDPDGKLQKDRPAGVSKTRSWIKATEVTYRVRQRGSYTVTAAIPLKGRRKYNFSLKFRPAGYYGYVDINANTGEKKFNEGLAELHSPKKWDHENEVFLADPFYSTINEGADFSYKNRDRGAISRFDSRRNPNWLWGSDPVHWHAFAMDLHSGGEYHPFGMSGGTGASTRHASDAENRRPWNQNWLWPGADSLVTNFIESSSLGVEFFYGQSTISSNSDIPPVFNDGQPRASDLGDNEKIPEALDIDHSTPTPTKEN